jgi:hypothetical protein
MNNCQLAQEFIPQLGHCVLLMLLGLFKKLSFSARARAIPIEALMIYTGSNHIELKISTLYLAKALTN